MYDRVLVITNNLYYSKIPSTGIAVLLRSTVPTSAREPDVAFLITASDSFVAKHKLSHIKKRPAHARF